MIKKDDNKNKDDNENKNVLGKDSPVLSKIPPEPKRPNDHLKEEKDLKDWQDQVKPHMRFFVL